MYKGVGLTHPHWHWPELLAQVLLSACKLPQPPRPGQLSTGNFYGMGTVHSLVGMKSITVEGQEPTHSCGPSASPMQGENMPGTEPWMFLSHARPLHCSTNSGRLLTRSLGTLRISFLGSRCPETPDILL